MTTKKRKFKSPYLVAILQALFVTFLWSTSWVLIKIGLDEIPAITFAGLRYSLAFLFLLPLFLHKHKGTEWHQLTKATVSKLLLLGVVYYALTHGAQFVSIAYLPAVTANLILGFTPAVVALLGLFFLSERPLPPQWFGIGLSLVGLLLYFYPIQLPTSQVIGLLVSFVGMMANGISAILGRAINRTKTLSPLLITTFSMGIGAGILLTVGILTEGFPTLSLRSWLIIFWLAIVNTAFAFTLWNHTLRTLSAMESSLINNTMSVQIPILAVLFLGERLTGRELLGLIIIIVGAFIVQFAGILHNR